MTQQSRHFFDKNSSLAGKPGLQSKSRRKSAGLSLLMSAALFAGCSSENDTVLAPGATDCLPELAQASSAQGLLMATVPYTYLSSTLQYLDFSTGCLRTILAGQTGDPLVELIDGELMLFNRAPEESNFSGLQLNGGLFLQDVQISMPLQGWGDPAEVIGWKNDELLMLIRDHQTIARIDRKTGDLVHALDVSDWDTAGQPFFPNAMIHKDTSLGELLFVINSFYDSYEDHRLFVLKPLPDGSIEPLDLDPELEGVQGMVTVFNNPSRILYGERSEPLIVSVCTSHAKPDCQGGVELFNSEKMESEKLFDFKLLGEFGEAQFDVLEAASIESDSYEFYMRVSKKDESARKILSIDPVNGQIKVVQELAPDSTGETTMFHDSATGLLVVAEGFDPEPSRLTFYLPNGEKRVMAVDGMPVSGVFVPK